MGVSVARPGWRGVGVAAAGGLLAALAALPGSAHAPDPPPDPAAGFRFPTVPPGHRHARQLLANALRYAAPANQITDPVSGYPYEGWNRDPERKLFLRSFTQLTAIGLWMEVLANVAAGQVETPDLTRDQALAHLARIVTTLRQDQRDPQLSAKGLLGNFLDLSTGRRLGPLTAYAERPQFLAEFGREHGAKIWAALVAKGWLAPRGADGSEAEVKRAGEYGTECFDGPLKPHCDEATKKRVMTLLDRRTVLVTFGDNANLTTSAAKTAGALLHPAVEGRPEAAAVRRDLEKFLDAQQEGYAHLYDAKAGLFYFGWDGQKERLVGWENAAGKWVTGHADYLVNEFRGPTTFVTLRHGLPLAAVKNLGFKMKPYRLRDGRDVTCLAPWEGSAFQLLGLELSLGELDHPSWRAVLGTAVDVETDYSARNGLPGFLSECYTGNGVQYTGDVGIPDLTVSPNPRVTSTASLYTLGVAYTVAPDKVERFLADNWPTVSSLFTDHGPWEGYNVVRKEPVRIQTTAHTASLALGLLGNGSDHMRRYLAARGLTDRLADVFRPGPAADLLPAGDTAVFAWSAKDRPVRSAREADGFRVTGERVGEVGIAVVPASPAGVNLSGGVLGVRYRSAGPAAPVIITLKPVGGAPPAVIATEIFTRFADTGGREEEVRVPLPATPGLAAVKEVVFTVGRGAPDRPIDLTLVRVGSTPAAPAPAPPAPPAGER